MTAEVGGFERPRVSVWNDPKVRSIAVQVIMVLVIGFFAYEIVHNTIANLTKRNISTGFAFLNKSAGFDLIQSLVEFSSESSYGQALIAGFLNTLLVASFGICLCHSARIFHRHHAVVKKLAGVENRDTLYRERYAMCRCCCRCLSGMARC